MNEEHNEEHKEHKEHIDKTILDNTYELVVYLLSTPWYHNIYHPSYYEEIEIEHTDSNRGHIITLIL